MLDRNLRTELDSNKAKNNYVGNVINHKTNGEKYASARRDRFVA